MKNEGKTIRCVERAIDILRALNTRPISSLDFLILALFLVWIFYLKKHKYLKHH
ncbi:hypothetical protein [Yersinia enterocolitica]|uniref:hypothetical protein n=1 Tax=Yersinia enterocolitica TaxID=630 RepID=UPI0012F68470|nr:hypothetical protein [Yersinia enterocolitica]